MVSLALAPALLLLLLLLVMMMMMMMMMMMTVMTVMVMAMAMAMVMMMIVTRRLRQKLSKGKVMATEERVIRIVSLLTVAVGAGGGGDGSGIDEMLFDFDHLGLFGPLQLTQTNRVMMMTVKQRCRRRHCGCCSMIPKMLRTLRVFNLCWMTWKWVKSRSRLHHRLHTEPMRTDS
jgi:hypothetical protein